MISVRPGQVVSSISRVKLWSFKKNRNYWKLCFPPSSGGSGTVLQGSRKTVTKCEYTPQSWARGSGKLWIGARPFLKIPVWVARTHGAGGSLTVFGAIENGASPQVKWKFLFWIAEVQWKQVWAWLCIFLFHSSDENPVWTAFVRESGDNLFELPRSWSKLLSQGKEVAAAGLETEGGWIPRRCSETCKGA